MSFIGLLTLALALQSGTTDVTTVVNRAIEYVAKYEVQLGNLIGNEDYTQKADWLNATVVSDRPATKGAIAAPGMTPKSRTLHTLSDFMIINVGSEWVALREVNEVNAAKVKRAQPDFENAFDDSPSGNTKRIKNLKAESTKYNIGDVVREINLPTFALQVLRKDDAPRFKFDKDGTETIDGIKTLKVRFSESKGPTLAVSADGKDLLSKGTLWIEPVTGRVLKTEILVQNHYTKPSIQSRVVVTYAQSKSAGVLVPNAMLEHYETEDNIIDCRAFYSNFRPFTVDVKFEIAPSPKP